MEELQWNIDTIAHVIDISVAPVFLLAGISGLLMVLTNRLGRTIDRSRSLQAALSIPLLPQQKDSIDREIRQLLKRGRFINLAINLATVSAFMVCLVIITLFLGSLIRFNVAQVVASLFIACLSILSAAFFCFSMEVFIASRSFRETLLSPERYNSPDQS